MKFLLPFVVAVLASGCQTEPEIAPVAAKPEPAAKTTEPAPAPPVAIKQEKPATPPATTTKSGRRVVTERIFQMDDLETVKVKLAGKTFTAFVTDTEMKMAEGMMYLKDSDVKDTECFIFVFPEPQDLGFWMRNTLIDLDIAYIKEDKTIRTIRTMKAHDETSVRSNGEVLYAIEFKAGTLKKIGAKVGMPVEIPASVRFKGPNQQ
ncbi:MAG: DUF192 domain-containing protein [Chthonomonas sp.]|nr:DUF192 domain-containing protein [Chthonomonas sp.]